MEVIKIRPLPAKDLVFPFIRGLAGIFACVEAMGRAGQTALPDPLIEDWRNLFRFMDEALQQLTRQVEAAAPEAESLFRQSESLRDTPKIIPATIRELNEYSQSLADLCRSHKKEFRAAYTADRESYGQLFRQIVGGRELLFLHGSADTAAAETIAGTMRDGCFYEVEQAPLSAFNQYRGTAQMMVVYSTRPAELNQVLRAAGPAAIDVALVDLGEKDAAYNPSLARQAMVFRKTDIRVIYRPFATIRLLQELERVHQQRLYPARRGEAAARKAGDVTSRAPGFRMADTPRRKASRRFGRNRPTTTHSAE
jgi:hypothetical protein